MRPLLPPPSLRGPAAVDGRFSIDVPTTGGTSALTVGPLVSPRCATADVKWILILASSSRACCASTSRRPGRTTTDWLGNYAYLALGGLPRLARLRIQAFQVFDAGYPPHLRPQDARPVADLREPLGAQLVDIYVHDPGAAAARPRRPRRRCSARFRLRSCTLEDPADPGAGLRRALRECPPGRRKGRCRSAADQISGSSRSGYRRPRRSTAAGWGFHVTWMATGCGFSGDETRPRLRTHVRKPFQIGVCAAPSADPHCTFAPGLVPKTIDVITAPGVQQSTELDRRPASARTIRRRARHTELRPPPRPRSPPGAERRDSQLLPRETATGTSAASAKAAASRNGVENASVTARSS